MPRPDFRCRSGHTASFVRQTAWRPQLECPSAFWSSETAATRPSRPVAGNRPDIDSPVQADGARRFSRAASLEGRKSPRHTARARASLNAARPPFQPDRPPAFAMSLDLLTKLAGPSAAVEDWRGERGVWLGASTVL